VIVLDASAVLEWLFDTPKADALQRILAIETNLHAPELIDVEVAQVIRRYHLNQNISAERCSQALDDFCDLPIHRVSHRDLLPLIWHYRDNLSAYDAAYVALAELLNTRLVTSDRKLSNAPRLAAEIQLLE
jgi:predicted nucleic acid-binding protein